MHACPSDESRALCRSHLDKTSFSTRSRTGPEFINIGKNKILPSSENRIVDVRSLREVPVRDTAVQRSAAERGARGGSRGRESLHACDRALVLLPSVGARFFSVLTLRGLRLEHGSCRGGPRGGSHRGRRLGFLVHAVHKSPRRTGEEHRVAVVTAGDEHCGRQELHVAQRKAAQPHHLLGRLAVIKRDEVDGRIVASESDGPARRAERAAVHPTSARPIQIPGIASPKL
jgi:hypothetical protein